jgi:2-polyprenyl-3-methyl-5-hydroxy-6-metoxy-1,4-benzoquinol methylase
MRYYTVSRSEEVMKVNKAVAYYHEWAQIIRKSTVDWDYLKKYYRGLLDPQKTRAIEFRALFFALRIQPVLTYVEDFVKINGRSPHILDLGCGFGMESLLICHAGAKVHAIDVSREKIALAPRLLRVYQINHGVKLDISFEFVNLFRFSTVQQYDAVYSSATLHHIEPVAEAMRVIAGLIKSGGKFFLSDENGANIIQQLAIQKQLGWIAPRVVWQADPETGKMQLYGNENIRPGFLWARFLRNACLIPRSIKYCRFFPPLPVSIERLVKWERMLRSIPILTELSAIGFLLTADRP